MTSLDIIAEILSRCGATSVHERLGIKRTVNPHLEIGKNFYWIKEGSYKDRYWENHYRDVKVKLTSAEINTGYSVNRLLLFEQDDDTLCKRFAPIIIPGAIVQITLNLEAIANSKQIVLKEGSLFTEPEKTGNAEYDAWYEKINAEDGCEWSDQYIFQHKVDAINSVAGIPFGKNTAIIDLKYAKVIPYTTIQKQG